ncbi:MAG: alpha/beta fold hydrolase [Pseudomonadota bacterium]
MSDLAELEARIAAAEAQVPNMREGCAKRIIWADGVPSRTQQTVVFIHGFSATGEELRPLPDLIAKGLGANLFFTRLTGHGQDGDAIGRATLADWQTDVTEALEVGAGLGEEVIVIGCSTGCTLVALALADGAQVKATIHVSPNFGLAHRVVQWLLDAPGARHWAKYIAGRRRSFPPENAAHAKFWTLEYPTEAVHVMADAVRAARKADLSGITTPALFCYNRADRVVSASATDQVIARWGGPTDVVNLIQRPEDDPNGHVMAGDTLSPGQTAPLARQVLAWLDGLPAV